MTDLVGRDRHGRSMTSGGGGVDPYGLRAEPADAVDRRLLVAFSERNAGSDPVHFQAPPNAEAWTCALADASQRWYALLDHETSVVGLVVFSRCAGPPWRIAEVGYAVDEAAVGRGYVQRGVGPLLRHHLGTDLARVEARVEPTNERAARSLARLGFRLEGRARACLDGPGGRIDQDQWAIVAGDEIGRDSGDADPRPGSGTAHG